VNAILAWFNNPLHASAATLFIYHAYSAFIGSLEMPDATSGKGYRFLFRFVNQLAANYSRAGAAKSVPTEAPKT
jgi:hypothetical protein